ncbi:MAG: hypothetical protein RR140_01255 [Clostridia bacterium]
MKKRTVPFVLALALFVPTIAGILVGCCGAPAKASASAKSVYAFSAFTSGQYLTSGGGTGLSQSNENGLNKNNLFSASPYAGTARPELIKNDIEKVNTYIGMFEGYLKANSVKPESAKPTVEVDGEKYGAYNIKLSSTLATSKGNVKYTIYYNEVAKGTDATDPSDDIVVKAEDEELEVSTSLNGWMVVGDPKATTPEELVITGERTVTTEGNETEAEVEFVTTKGTKSITVKQSVELNEIEFGYEIKDGENVISETEVSWESEENEKPELEIQFKNAQHVADGVEYLVKQDATGGYKVTYSVDEVEKGFFTVKVKEDDATKFIYTYEDGFNEPIAR